MSCRSEPSAAYVAPTELSQLIGADGYKYSAPTELTNNQRTLRSFASALVNMVPSQRFITSR